MENVLPWKGCPSSPWGFVGFSSHPSVSGNALIGVPGCGFRSLLQWDKKTCPSVLGMLRGAGTWISHSLSISLAFTKKIKTHNKLAVSRWLTAIWNAMTVQPPRFLKTRTLKGNPRAIIQSFEHYGEMSKRQQLLKKKNLVCLVLVWVLGKYNQLWEKIEFYISYLLHILTMHCESLLELLAVFVFTATKLIISFWIQMSV